MGGDVAGANLHGVSPANHGYDTPGGIRCGHPWTLTGQHPPMRQAAKSPRLG
ncbi:hypothetical protein HMPREF9080_02849 [Cardiobacterium valvarum F0432]|uniref:Uncharacterized protein n=1 Tax=Cardiobacterium valvarum F0432 TaxID=797473 RepID=G9ZJ80_9GAMM|nr:hypothetical protein HMPREF9080_02849 [Cardiobacterium valvarum F0432]